MKNKTDWKIETLEKLIEIEKENGRHESIITMNTMNYINYLKALINMIKYWRTL